MGELESDEIEPDGHFYDEKNPENRLNERLYLLMKTQRTQNELVSLWKRFEKNLGVKSERRLGKFREVLEHLSNIRYWGTQDKLLDAGLFDAWESDLNDGDRMVLFVTEFWFRGSHDQRELSTKHIIKLVEKMGGEILSQSVIESIAFHSQPAKFKSSAIYTISENLDVKVVLLSSGLINQCGQDVIQTMSYVTKKIIQNMRFEDIGEAFLPKLPYSHLGTSY